MSFDWLENIWKHIDKFFLMLGAFGLSAVAVQKTRKQYRSDQADAAVSETRIDLIGGLREEIDALQAQNAAIMTQFLALQREHVAVQTRLSQLTVKYDALNALYLKLTGVRDGR